MGGIFYCFFFLKRKPRGSTKKIKRYLPVTSPRMVMHAAAIIKKMAVFFFI